MGIYTTQVRSYSRVLYIYFSEIIMIMYNRISFFYVPLQPNKQTTTLCQPIQRWAVRNKQIYKQPV